MSQQAATIMSLPQAFEVVKEMQAGGLDWGEGYRPLGRQALAEIIEGRMAEAVDRWLDNLDAGAMRDRRNGTYRRCLLSELGDIELNVPRTRHFCPTGVVKSYARRAPEIDRAILAGFVLGLSTRKVGEVLLALLGRPVSAAAVEAFHRRPLKNAYKALMLDGVVLARKTVSRVSKTLDMAGPQDRRRRAQEAGPGGARHPPRRQEGDHRLPSRRQRRRPRVGSVPQPAVPPRAHRRRP